MIDGKAATASASTFDNLREEIYIMIEDWQFTSSINQRYMVNYKPKQPDTSNKH